MKLNIKTLILILGLTLISILNVSVPKSIQQKIYNLSGVDKSVLILVLGLGSVLSGIVSGIVLGIVKLKYINIKNNFDLIKLILRRSYIPP